MWSYLPPLRQGVTAVTQGNINPPVYSKRWVLLEAFMSIIIDDLIADMAADNSPSLLPPLPSENKEERENEGEGRYVATTPSPAVQQETSSCAGW